MYGVTFKEYLIETNDNEENFYSRHKKKIGLLRDNRSRINKRILMDGLNHPYDEDYTLQTFLDEIEIEIILEKENFKYIIALDN